MAAHKNLIPIFIFSKSNAPNPNPRLIFFPDVPAEQTLTLSLPSSRHMKTHPQIQNLRNVRERSSRRSMRKLTGPAGTSIHGDDSRWLHRVRRGTRSSR
ncbi:hypothetical protein M6B38_222340 [Iris pallida]|uniref:Uncharacterized protein n=1 Tax=Iris pallida TaxID=29817 RepID=A0AAX6DWQ9_IRIPA|nr:hypothetical protein M6B38_222340 [Iris pallida]